MAHESSRNPLFSPVRAKRSVCVPTASAPMPSALTVLGRMVLAQPVPHVPMWTVSAEGITPEGASAGWPGRTGEGGCSPRRDGRVKSCTKGGEDRVPTLQNPIPPRSTCPTVA